MLGPIRFMFALIWFAIGLAMVGSLKDCTASMGREAAHAHRRGGISYGWWNRALLDGRAPLDRPSHIPAMAKGHEDNDEKGNRRGNSLSRPEHR